MANDKDQDALQLDDRGTDKQQGDIAMPAGAFDQGTATNRQGIPSPGAAESQGIGGDATAQQAQAQAQAQPQTRAEHAQIQKPQA